LHACPPQSRHVEQAVGGAHVVDPFWVRTASSKWTVRSALAERRAAKMDPKSVVGALPPSTSSACGA
jgi:hypothetical protein